MFNLTSSAPKSWQTVSRQADRANAEQSHHTYQTEPIPTIQELGIVLRERREAMGASLAEVETATRIRQKYLAALESDDWHLLPGEIVGRGFLRNYATYLGLDQTELVERRRAVADPDMASTLVGTSAASPLPPERNVDYRPKDVSLMDEPEGIQQREIRTGPLFTVLGTLGALLLIWWLVTSFGTQISTGIAASVNGVQTRVAPAEVNNVNALATSVAAEAATSVALQPPAVLEAPAATEMDSAANEPTTQQESSVPPLVQPVPPANNEEPAVAIEPTATPTEAAAQRLLIPTDTPGDGAAQLAEPAASAPVAEEVATDAEVLPTATATQPPPPTATPEPLPTATPVPPPTAVPTPAQPIVVAPACPDPRAALSSPGVNQTIAGTVAVTGSATHEAFQYYKLEYAVGANVTDGFVYFDGANSPVEGGTLGILNTPSLPNGAYTLQLTVVDLSANYPPPCRVSVVIQN